MAQAFAQYLDIRKDVYGDRDKSLSLMDMACIGAKYLKKHGKADDLDESEEINACSIKVRAKIDGREEDWLVMFRERDTQPPYRDRAVRRSSDMSRRSDKRPAFRQSPRVTRL